jgi:alanine racemase
MNGAIKKMKRFSYEKLKYYIHCESKMQRNGFAPNYENSKNTCKFAHENKFHAANHTASHWQ